MSRAARIGIFSVSVLIFCYAGIGHVLGRTSDDKAYKSLTVYGEVLQKIQQDYVDDPNMRTVTAGSLHGLLESLDSQSSYLTPREYEEYKKKLANSAREPRSPSSAAGKPRRKKSISFARKWPRQKLSYRRRIRTFSCYACPRSMQAAPMKYAIVSSTRKNREFTKSFWMCVNAAEARSRKPFPSRASLYLRAR